MNSSITNISEILNSTEGLISAGFSDGYNFDDVNAEEYFYELLENSTFPSPIFSGILVMQKDEDRFILIDGLQRVTTICLLLCALCENYRNTSKKNALASEKLFDRYLINKNKAPKLKLTGEDRTIYKKILLNENLTEKEEKNNLALAYKSFLIKTRERKVLGTELFNIISKIQFMVVLVESSDVPARELYQAINSKDKSQINLISDYIAQKSNGETKTLWLDILNHYKRLGRLEVFEDFLRDFLVIQNEGKTPNKNALYNNFKSYFIKMSKYIEANKIVENVVKYSNYYLKIFNADFEDEEIKEQINTLNENQGKDAYPYLMEVLDDLENSHIERDIFVEILTAINLFIKSKQEDAQSDFSIDFTSLSKELNKMLILKVAPSEQETENKLTINEINKL